MTTHLNPDAVDRRLERLRGDYEGVPVFEEDEEIPADAFANLRSRAEDGYTGAGYAWTVRDPAEAPPLAESMADTAGSVRPQALLILGREVSGPHWSLPGGGREDGETYEQAAAREVREETGVTVDLGDPFLFWRGRYRSAAADPPDVVLHLLWVCFDAAYEDGTLAIQPGELRGAAWFEESPTSLRAWGEYRATAFWTDHHPTEPWWEAAEAVNGEAPPEANLDPGELRGLGE